MIICYWSTEPGYEHLLLIWGFKPHSPLHDLTVLGAGSCAAEQKRMQKSCSQEKKKTSGGMITSVVRALTWNKRIKKLCIRFLIPKLFLCYLKCLTSILTHILEGLRLLHSHLQLLIFQECKALLRITAFQDTISPLTNNDSYSLLLALWPCIWLH